jgi:arylsulfatase A-like enzyme
MKRTTKNILFIMFDQLRWDYLGCSGHPSLTTPHMDRLAEKGVRFSRCYVQSPICGASRMSFYTGRYVHSHGAAWNNFPLKIGELTLGDHLRKLDMETWLIGKTHMKADIEGMERLGISRDGLIGARVAECGFDVYLRDDGLWGEGPDGSYDESRSPYNEYLRSKGYTADNPWSENANSGVNDLGEIASGWLMKHGDRPANIREEDSETPWLTSQAIDFIESRHYGQPWMAHISYIKPHWPYIVPAPYHNMYGHNQIKPVVRSAQELENPHPVLAQYQNSAMARVFQKDAVRDVVVPAYMGLIKQCDDQMGRLFEYLEKSGRMDDTMIVLTSDHGDYLGDHWLGEKDMFHECSVKIPLIVYDPSPDCDAARGTVCDELVESIDLAATFVDAAGGSVPGHIIEGRSLLPLLRGEKPASWREFAISEYNYSATAMAENLGLKPREARLFMVADKRWKFIHSEGPGHRAMLFDMESDPDELADIGGDPHHQPVLDVMYERLGRWARRMSQRTTISDQQIGNMTGRSRRKGILVGLYDGSEVDEELLKTLRGKPKQNFVQSEPDE